MLHIAAGLFLVFTATGVASASEEAVFVIHKSGTPVYAKQNSGSTSTTNVNFKEVLFATREDRGERVLLHGRDCASGREREVGWVQRDEVLSKRSSVLTIAEALDKYPKLERFIPISSEIGGFNHDNSLNLRVVSKPEQKTKVYSEPNSSGGHVETIKGFRWFFVYDFKDVGGESWVLLANNPEVYDPNNKVCRTVAENTIFGWAPLDFLTIWPTNYVLEINTNPTAVIQRLEDDKPAFVLQRESLEFAVQESLNEWWGTNNAGKVFSKNPETINLDPVGLSNTFPRAKVIQRRGKYFDVVTLGGVGRQDVTQITENRHKLERANDDLHMVDMVFVIDSSGSMEPAIKETIKLIDSVIHTMKKFSIPSSEFTINAGPTKLKLTDNLDFRVSVIRFSGQFMDDECNENSVRTAITLSPLTSNDVSNALQRVLEHTKSNDGCEPVLHALLEAMKDKYWREASAQRVIILLSDEGGYNRGEGVKLNNKNANLWERNANLKEKLVDKMPKYEESLYSTLLDNKRDRTKIYSIYLGPEENFWAFEENVSYVSKRIFELFDFNDHYDPEGRKLYAYLKELFEQTQREAKDKVTRMANRMNQTDAEIGFDDAPRAHDAEINRALKRNNLTAEKLVELGNLIHVPGRIEVVKVAEFTSDDYPHWRTRVIVSKDQAERLLEFLTSSEKALERTLKRSEDAHSSYIAELLGIQDPDRKTLIATVILSFTHAVSAKDRFPDMDPEERYERVKNLIELITKGELKRKGFDNLLELSESGNSLPIRNDGLLGLELEELLDKDLAWFALQHSRIRDRVKGWKAIMNGIAIPEDPRQINSSSKNHNKDWFSTQMMLGKDQEFAYVPLNYFP